MVPMMYLLDSGTGCFRMCAERCVCVGGGGWRGRDM